jgi:hypothetical protein
MCPLDPALLAPPYKRFRVSRELADQYIQLFVNRPEYSMQASKPMMNGRIGWYLARDRNSGQPRILDTPTVASHINGDITINLYSTNPETQRSKWVAIDADYDGCMKDLLQLRYELKQDGIQAALEQSRRGGHLWIFGETPLLASECRIYIYNLALRLGIPVQGGGLRTGIEVFPKQDRLEEGEFGNAIRGPLGVHRRVRRRYWFIEAEQTPERQMAYLEKVRKLTEDQLRTFTAGMTLPEAYQPPPPVVYQPRPQDGSNVVRREFRILDYVRPRSKDRRNYWAQCPSCARANADKSQDNLAIQIADPRFYKCWAGCTKEDIRAALGQPLPSPRFA